MRWRYIAGVTPPHRAIYGSPANLFPEWLLDGPFPDEHHLGLADDAARALAADPGIWWHQRFGLSANVRAPGANVIDGLCWMLHPDLDLTGLSVLDIGTTNGGAAFLAERRGASRVVAVDIAPPTLFGFAQIAEAVGSNVQFLQASVYELPNVLQEQFDIVYFFGVLYHLRHPLLAIDALRQVTRGVLGVETELSGVGDAPGTTQFYPERYKDDPGNWFVPSLTTAHDWLTSSGFDVHDAAVWPDWDPSRGFLACRPSAVAPELGPESVRVAPRP